MNVQEIRAKALEMAVNAQAGDAPGDILRVANIFQDYIAHGPMPEPVQPLTPGRCEHRATDGRQCTREPLHIGLHTIRQTERPEHSRVQPVDHDGIWGPLCIVCGHPSGAHAQVGGCHEIVKSGMYCTCEEYPAGAA